MPRRKLNYKEGDWFAVPLRDRGYAAGLIARASQGFLFGYFFGPRRDQIPRLDDVLGFVPENAILRAMFGDLGLLEANWPIIGRSIPWNRLAWPLPPFVRIDVVNPRKAYKTTYSESDLSLDGILETVECDPREAPKYPEDGLYGYGAVELKLTALLSKR